MIKKEKILSFIVLCLCFYLLFNLLSVHRSEKISYKCFNCNVILIVIDALRADHLGSYGYYRNTSPNIDLLAKDSVLFENAITQGTWTALSIASLFTSDNPLYNIDVNYPDEILSDSAVTLAETLKEKGYNTQAFIGGNSFLGSDLGFDQGFNNYNELNNSAHRITKEVKKWVSENFDEKFFLYLHCMEPHADYNPPPPYDKKYDPEYDGRVDFKNKHQGQLNKINLTEKDIYHLVALYDGEINAVDDSIGELISYLKELNIYDDTLIIILSDHGEELMDHGMVGHGLLVFDSSIKVPLLIKFPYSSFSGMRVSSPVRVIDIMPTILDVLNLPTKNLKGSSIIPILGGFHVNRTIFTWGSFRLSVRRSDYKLILDIMNDKVELYELKSDPDELINVAEKHPDIVKELMEEISREDIDLFKIKYKDFISGEKIKEKLRELGYIA